MTHIHKLQICTINTTLTLFLTSILSHTLHICVRRFTVSGHNAIVYIRNFNLYQYHVIALKESTSPSFFQQAPIILLKEGTDTSQGKPQILSNITACLGVVDAVRTTLGPRGMDKLVVDGHGKLIAFYCVLWVFSNRGHSIIHSVSRHFITHHHAHHAYIIS